MKLLILTNLMFLLGSQAQADIFRCSFTEPFYSVTYSTTTRELEISGPENGQNLSNVSFQIRGRGSFELLSRTNQRLMTLNLNFQGSDGMSDFTYPYVGKIVSRSIANQILTGGCESNFLRKHLGPEQAESAPEP
jgi:uncharacterized membrane protein